MDPNIIKKCLIFLFCYRCGKPERRSSGKKWDETVKPCTKGESHAAAMQEQEEHNVIVLEQKQQIAVLSQEMEQLALCSEQKVAALTEQLKRCEEEYLALSSQMERAEQLHAQQFLAESGFYHDSAASPPLLQSAADAVKEAIAICASDLFAHVKRYSISLEFTCLGLDQCCGKPGGIITKIALQSFFCHLLFVGFEDPSFAYVPTTTPYFEKPKERKSHLFQKYERCRYLEPQQIFEQDDEFVHFVSAKGRLACTHLEKVLLINEAQLRHEFLHLDSMNNTDNPFHKSFWRLTKAVWILHKLAFSFEPTAEITRIARGSTFDEEYMENMVQADEDENAANNRAVGFVCAPGFTVRKTIIKSRVFLKVKTQTTD